jgi:hypothetical protein
MTEPRRDHYLPPTIGEDSEVVLDAAPSTRSAASGGWASTATPPPPCTCSPASSPKPQQRLPRAVADARDQDCSWAEIADLLGVTRASAWQRYARRTPANRTPLDPD